MEEANEPTAELPNDNYQTRQMPHVPPLFPNFFLHGTWETWEQKEAANPAGLATSDLL